MNPSDQTWPVAATAHGGLVRLLGPEPPDDAPPMRGATRSVYVASKDVGTGVPYGIWHFGGAKTYKA